MDSFFKPYNMPREVEQSSPLNDEKPLSYVTRRQADKEIDKMLKDCVKSNFSINSYHFPGFGGLLVQLKEGKDITSYVVKLIENRYNLKTIEKVSRVK